MPRVSVFENVTLDGYFADREGDMTWAHKHDAEWRAFGDENARAGGVLAFGRVTYEMMASFWPTPMAAEAAPVIARRMNELPKVVFSRTLDAVGWANTRLVKTDPAAEIQRMKREPGPDIAIMGSGSIVAQLAQHGLIDEYKIVVNPLALGGGRALFHGMTRRLALELTSTRAFGNGNVLLCYKPAA